MDLVAARAYCLMQFSFLASSLLLSLAGSARASDDTGGAETEPPAEEIIVYGEMEIARKRAKVIQNLKHLGYREATRRDGRSIMRPEAPYKPTIIVDDDAWMHVKRSPVRIDPPGKDDNNLRYLWCLPPFTITAACIQVGGQVIAERKLAHFKGDIARATSYEMRQWRKAVIAHAMDKRLGEEIPDMLDRIWEQGKAEDENNVLLLEHSERRSAIFDFWASRSCVPEGEAVRAVAADFITEVIQHSEHPATDSEIRSANEKQRCPASKMLPIESARAP